MITDWDAAYANAAAVAGSARWPDAWGAKAAAFRAGGVRARYDLGYGAHPRERFDLFEPEGAARGLVLFAHGGYWMKFDKSLWSHLAAGSLARGWAVALPSYPLAPEVRIAEITASIGRAVAAAAGEIAGPIRLAGHSAGGHLATRMVTRGAPIDAAVAARIERVVSISGLHDLRPLIRATRLNETLRLDAAEARAESAALLDPDTRARIVLWVGADELPEFRRQSALLANIWSGCGAEIEHHAPPGHHFNIVDGLAEPESALTERLAG